MFRHVGSVTERTNGYHIHKMYEVLTDVSRILNSIGMMAPRLLEHIVYTYG